MRPDRILSDIQITPAAVLFDIDGVLVDSYEAHFLSWQKFAERHGRSCTEEDFARGFGRTSREVLQTQWPDWSLSDSDIHRLDEEKEQIYRDITTESFPAMPGARELIERLIQAGWKVALGSSGPRENVDLAINKLNLESLIGAAISGNDVTYGKPDPEVFLKAAERLSVPPDRCIVIEDAPAGVQAAHSAGMKCIGFLSKGRTPEQLAQADRQIHALSECTEDLLHQLLEADTPKNR